MYLSVLINTVHSTEADMTASPAQAEIPTTQPDDEPSTDQTQEVIIRRVPAQPRVASFKEEAVISKPPLRKSLKTADETVTVTFVTKSSHIKTPFPVTHRQLLRDEDLESPGVSDEEGAGTRDSTFTTPGFDHLDASTFDDFGTTIKPRLEEVDKKKGDDVRKTLNLDESTTNELKQSDNDSLPIDETVLEEAVVKETVAVKMVTEEVVEKTVEDEPVEEENQLLSR